MQISEYIDKIDTRFKKGIKIENINRGDLQKLLNTLLPNTAVTNNPNSTRCGGPNLTISQNGLPIGFIKTTDLGTDLNQLDGIEDIRRYKSTLSNLITTNYIDFHWYKDGELISSFSLKII